MDIVIKECALLSFLAMAGLAVAGRYGGRYDSSRSCPSLQRELRVHYVDVMKHLEDDLPYHKYDDDEEDPERAADRLVYEKADMFVDELRDQKGLLNRIKDVCNLYRDNSCYYELRHHGSRSDEDVEVKLNREICEHYDIEDYDLDDEDDDD